MAAEQQLAIRTAVSKGRCDMLLLVAGGFEPFLANHMLRIVGTCWNMLEHVGTCWNAILVHIRTISQSVREMLSGETVLHFRARGFPYEIDLKVHMQVSN